MIRVEVHGAEAGSFAGLGEIVIDRPEKRNALTPEMLEAITAGIATLEADAAARAIVLRGEGTTFCAGFDLTLCREDSAALGAMLRGLSDAVRALRRCARPVVVGARGAAIAGGCALLAAADFVVTHAAAKFGYPVVALGISPAVNAPYLLNAIGERAARAKLLDPRIFDGEEARRLGLASVLVDLPEDVTPRAQVEAMRLASKPPAAFAATKAWLNELEGSLDDARLARALEASMALVGSDEERERLSALWT